MEIELKEIIEYIIKQYDNKLPLSVIQSLATSMRLIGGLHPVKYETHFKPFIDIRDRVYYKVFCIDGNTIKIENILISHIKNGQEDDYLVRVQTSKVFNWSWLDDIETNDFDFTFGYSKEEVNEFNETMTLILTLI